MSAHAPSRTRSLTVLSGEFPGGNLLPNPGKEIIWLAHTLPLPLLRLVSPSTPSAASSSRRSAASHSCLALEPPLSTQRCSPLSSFGWSGHGYFPAASSGRSPPHAPGRAGGPMSSSTFARSSGPPRGFAMRPTMFAPAWAAGSRSGSSAR